MKCLRRAKTEGSAALASVNKVNEISLLAGSPFSFIIRILNLCAGRGRLDSSSPDERFPTRRENRSSYRGGATVKNKGNDIYAVRTLDFIERIQQLRKYEEICAHILKESALIFLKKWGGSVLPA